MDGKTWYQVSSLPLDSGDAPRWYLFVESASTALECIRRQRPSISDVALSLVEKGIPFTTRLQLLQLPQSLPDIPPPMNLGWRFTDYLPNCLDYRAYQERRKALLLEPRGRVALLTGGIVWRLALEVLRPETVLVGPLLEEYGGYVSPENSQTVLWDEVLTPSELDLICGVYHVAKGESVAIFSIHNLSIVFRLFESGNPSFMVAKG